MRTLVATTMYNVKGKEIYCTPKKVNGHDIDILRNISRPRLEEAGFTFIRMLSLDYPNVKGNAIFYEGHYDDMVRTLKKLQDTSH